MTDAPEDLDALIRRVDPDRWLASRFIADAEARADVIALYAFNYELARVAGSVSQPLLGEIRLTWWSEAVAEVFAGGPVRRHPTVEALATAVRRRGLPREALEAMVTARFADLDVEPLADESMLLAYLDATAGVLMRTAAVALGAQDLEFKSAPRAWGLTGLWRLGRLPPRWDRGAVRRRVRAALKGAHAELAKLPVSAFPAVSYAALSLPFLRNQPPSELERRLRLLIATVAGRI